MYNKQKEQSRKRQQRYRDNQKTVTNSNANKTVTRERNVTQVIPDIGRVIEKPANFGQPDCQCRHCQNNRSHGSRLVINHGPYKPASELSEGEVNRVSLPSDVDYAGCVA